MVSIDTKGETLKQSVGFSAIGNIGKRGIHLLGFVILARILSPYEFGLMAVISVFSLFASVFIEMGMGAALIHQHNPTEKHYSTAFWFNVMTGLMLCGIFLLSVDYVAEFFNDKKLKSIISVTAWLFPLNALCVVPMALLQRRQAFKTIAIVELVAVTIGISLAICLAIYGYGVWALVANLFATVIAGISGWFYFSKWRPRIIFFKHEFSELWSYSGYLFGSGIANFFISSIDSVLVGRILGSSALGVYKYAYQLATLPSLLISNITAKVFFVTYTKYRDDLERIKDVHFRAVRLIAFFTFPFMLILAAVSDVFVGSILGDKWIDMGHTLSFMCIIYMIDSIGGMNNPLFMSQGKTKDLFWITLLLRGNIVIAMFVGIQFGLDGLLWGILIAKLINFYPIYHFVGKTIGFTVIEFVFNCLPAFGLSWMVFAMVELLKINFPFEVGGIVLLISLLCFAVISYAGLSMLFQRKIIYEFMEQFSGFK